MRRVVILGSSRSNGNTAKMVRLLGRHIDFDVVDLRPLNIGHYDYDHGNHGDDFLPLMKRITSDYDQLIFATPIYWYAMSGIMKVFFDRITDLLKTEKETGRKLRGKQMALLICGSDAEGTPDFEMPFRESAGYLGMGYLGSVHTWLAGNEIEEEVLQRLKAFAESLS